MNKRKKINIILCASIISVLVCLFAFIFFTTGRVVLDSNKAVIQRNVVAYLRVQHGWSNERNLYAITTDEYYNYINENGIHDGNYIYTINKNFIKTYDQISNNRSQVTVEIYEPDVLFCVFTFKKVGDHYLIDSVEYDK